MSAEIEGQLSAAERTFITEAILSAPIKPRVAIEVGTWMGGGSTLHILRALEKNGIGHLYGIEASAEIFEKMVANIRRAAPDVAARFTPLCGLSHHALPKLLASQNSDFQVDFAFLDGGNSPMEQMIEFRLLDHHIPIGGQLLAHDARMRKGEFFVPYLCALDNWKTQLLDLSEVGLLHAVKTHASPSPASLKAARATLRRLRLQPKEFIAAILPSWLCGFILRALPRRLAHKLSDAT